MPVALGAARPELAGAARKLASRFGLAWLEAPDALPRLELGPDGLSLHCAGIAPVRLDFVGGRMGYRHARDIGRRQPLARALGIGQGLLDLVDATAGLGRDAFILAALGARVRMLERSPAVAALLDDGLRRATADPAAAEVIARMQLLPGDARAWLLALPEPDRPEAVYLDPMYPHRAKSAQVKKDMQSLRALLGPDLDSASLLEAALARARRRVVVKRPKGAGCLDGPRPDHSVSSPNTRYDVYLRH